MSGKLNELMRNTLDDLTMADFKKFKHHLRDQGKIPWGKLEKADTDDTVDLMMQTYTLSAGNVMVMVLKKINNNLLAMELEEKLGKLGGQNSDPRQVAGGGQGINVNAMSHSGGIVNAPIMSGCTIAGSVNFGSHMDQGGVSNYGYGNRTGVFPLESGQDFFRKHKGNLEMRLDVLTPVLIELESSRIITSIERETIESKSLRHERNRTLIVMLENKGTRAQEVFYKALEQHNPALVEDLQRC